ncbi:hypothetical protein HOLleu_01017 [Holothuria leucospilota]|uniref:HTH psq-type domain-containing protein n=1 Tax=Holothuria leucospilota TaxID=206669 RepID=A0A9Q1HK12_HOLLE|nr:hypothetical protein HOLleu_01017 [Holothuria leucospilota]
MERQSDGHKLKAKIRKKFLLRVFKMVRKYKALKRGPQHRWTKQSMANALHAIKSGNVKSHREAAKQFGVPRTTLIRRLKGVRDVDAPASKTTALTNEEEEMFVQYCLNMEKRGFGLYVSDICEKAYRILEISGRKKNL